MLLHRVIHLDCTQWTPVFVESIEKVLSSCAESTLEDKFIYSFTGLHTPTIARRKIQYMAHSPNFDISISISNVCSMFIHLSIRVILHAHLLHILVLSTFLTYQM